MNNMLEKFGEILIREVRDSVSEDYNLIKTGQIKSKIGRELYESMSSFDEKDLDTLDRFSEEIIDRVIHKFLFLFEESDEFTIAMKNAVTPSDDLVEESDGLSGELFGKAGWITKFSENLINSKR
ncbi:hypothetical protein FKX85_15820 [Echinicola soli]|uniref:Uncharacterized protein n=1 Tax=Echinicola soli TaxID=2591634 RepID=A0A514CKT1_9BACT|nr:hypothetical protein [Echinicola soli]QDH80429.1 hypothetical protein FKX85_15820 [Echinicola soli]